MMTCNTRAGQVQKQVEHTDIGRHGSVGKVGLFWSHVNVATLGDWNSLIAYPNSLFCSTAFASQKKELGMTNVWHTSAVQVSWLKHLPQTKQGPNPVGQQTRSVQVLGNSGFRQNNEISTSHF